MTPEDIERVVFKERFRGYDQDEVDRFLDLVAQELAALLAERDALAAQAGVAVGGGASAPQAAPLEDAGLDGVDHLVKRTLSAAQRTAEELLSDARARATELVEDARLRAQRDREQVSAQADLLRRAAEELRQFRDEYRSRLHHVVSEQLAALDRAGELPRLPAVVDEALRLAAPMPVPEEIVRPSSAQIWAEAAAEEPEADLMDSEDDLAAPWDDLWDDGSAEAESSDSDGEALRDQGLPDPWDPQAPGSAGDA